MTVGHASGDTIPRLPYDEGSSSGTNSSSGTVSPSPVPSPKRKRKSSKQSSSKNRTMTRTTRPPFLFMTIACVSVLSIISVLAYANLSPTGLDSWHQTIQRHKLLWWDVWYHHRVSEQEILTLPKQCLDFKLSLHHAVTNLIKPDDTEESWSAQDGTKYEVASDSARQGDDGEEEEQEEVEGIVPFVALSRNIYFLHFNPTFTAYRYLCSIESAARLNPEHIITVFAKNVTDLDRTLDKWRAAVGSQIGSRVLVKPIEYTRYFQDTPLERWWKEGKWRESHWVGQNLGNALRLAIVYKEGGVYMDMDIISLNPLHTLGRSIAREEADRINNAAMSFPQHDSLVWALMEEFVEGWNGWQWANNGPYSVTRMFQKRCQKTCLRLGLIPKTTGPPAVKPAPAKPPKAVPVTPPVSAPVAPPVNLPAPDVPAPAAVPVPVAPAAPQPQTPSVQPVAPPSGQQQPVIAPIILIPPSGNAAPVDLGASPAPESSSESSSDPAIPSSGQAPAEPLPIRPAQAPPKVGMPAPLSGASTNLMTPAPAGDVSKEGTNQEASSDVPPGFAVDSGSGTQPGTTTPVDAIVNTGTSGGTGELHPENNAAISGAFTNGPQDAGDGPSTPQESHPDSPANLPPLPLLPLPVPLKASTVGTSAALLGSADSPIAHLPAAEASSGPVDKLGSAENSAIQPAVSPQQGASDVVSSDYVNSKNEGSSSLPSNESTDKPSTVDESTVPETTDASTSDSVFNAPPEAALPPTSSFPAAITLTRRTPSSSHLQKRQAERPAFGLINTDYDDPSLLIDEPFCDNLHVLQPTRFYPIHYGNRQTLLATWTDQCDLIDRLKKTSIGLHWWNKLVGNESMLRNDSTLAIIMRTQSPGVVEAFGLKALQIE
ncbi:Lactosylceramide 4-alpha-galactosyltransferase [Thoreauomyces humboldtii]|nr:Lactosylceramide 4-alpha-galactosyltransferase [Thoreauomyces humboldtii]